MIGGGRVIQLLTWFHGIHSAGYKQTFGCCDIGIVLQLGALNPSSAIAKMGSPRLESLPTKGDTYSKMVDFVGFLPLHCRKLAPTNQLNPGG